MSKKPWEPQWKILRQLSQGGQGETHIVTRAGDANATECVLKILKNQSEQERRARMHREVSILKTLDSPSIPKVIDSNSELFNSRENVRLFVVIELIPGKTLSDELKSGLWTLERGCAFLLKILAILDYCHKKGVIHRDLKPDNVLLRNGDFNDPVLIDFGISFNASEETDTLTLDMQQLGNRFILLPELQGGSGLQRDFRSDITQACGLLFYVLTAQHPQSLMDQHGRKPHRRQPSQEILERHLGGQRFLRQMFDRAFESKIDSRFQSIKDLSALIEHRNDGDNETMSLANKTNQLRNDIVEASSRRELFQIYKDIVKQLHSGATQAASLCGESFTSRQHGTPPDWNKLIFTESLSLHTHLHPECEFFPVFVGRFTANEVSVEAHGGQPPVEIFRGSLIVDQDYSSIEARVASFLVDGFGINYKKYSEKAKETA